MFLPHSLVRSQILQALHGFVGTNLLGTILHQKEFEKVTVVDNLRYTANPEMLPELSHYKEFSFIEGDIQDKVLINRLVSEHDYVVNLAAQTFVDNSIDDSRIFFETNVLGMQTILEAARHSYLQKVVHISTDEVWGEAKKGRRFKEYMSYAPRNPYAASKAAADHLLTAYGETYGVPFNIVYLTNLLGPWQFPEKLIPSSIVKLIEGEDIHLYGNGKNVRTWLDMRDAVRGILLVLKKARNKEKYILGTDDEVTNVQIVEKLLGIFGQGWDKVKFVNDRPGHDLRYAVDYSKIKLELGWCPEVNLDRSLIETVKWFKVNSGWWKKRLVDKRRI